jgi:hypothetical protein
MARGLVFGGRLIEVAAADFPVAPGLEWVDCADGATPETHEFKAGAVTPRGPVVKTPEQRRAEIVASLARLDADSARPLREALVAIKGGGAVPTFAGGKLATIEGQAAALRAELAGL